MTSIQSGEHNTARNFMLSTELFDLPNLDIYTQMVCIVLRSYQAEAALPTLAELARMARMTTKQGARALQSLVQLQILPQKVFRQIVGDFADDRLSWSAKGLLAFCKDRPHVKLADLVEMTEQSHEDEQSIRRALKELKRFGYLDDFGELKRVIS